ncbi:ABC transporter ATP-binding protein [Gordonia paraffinivorans]|uniref:Iron-siderophore ABC transporter ATP-binding protein n=2 Tax=Gordonia paraffinivorans TaxID=175628 RepID=A0ABQ0IR76_9ACTN|nr:ABC transporter ATP-binding protein [Gordonia paraffinivorans]MBY4573457.1 ABC transporter [Gordonia paraffinivorans]PWD42885.1 ABC transporter [Gordonia paraffinivorans]GAC86040.1 putative iron-siderophore ABC transporter ATP-binding protein [Gordonia paraffinivorans NBRC 108238]VFA88315.1 Probable siderophore transport system ATP-binding protein YusV [Gordonia paraffinivorans]
MTSSPTEAAGTRTARLRGVGLTVGYDQRVVIDDLDIEIPDGEVTTIIGSNGCGKSTLLRCLARLLPPRAGTVYLDGEDITQIRPRQVARTLAILPQNPIAPEGLTVADLVARGRHPHQRWYQQATADDEAAIAEAMAMTDTLELADRTLDALSGGQRQRVWIALTLAQGTDLILLDEPTTYLDLAHSIDVLDLVRRLRDDHGKTVVMVLHDLNLAARYSDSLVVMKDGAIVMSGSPSKVIGPELLDEAFGLRAHVMTDPVSGGPLIVPLDAHTRGR